jgi:membrane fusion protein (multidrug efflux system)
MSTQTREYSVGTPDTPAPGTPAPSRRKRIIVFVALIILIIAVGFWLYRRGKASTDDAEVAEHLDPMSPQVGGTVIAVDVHDDQFVHKGDILYRLDPRPYQVAVEQAQANLQAAEAAARGANTNIPVTRTTASSGISSAQATLLEAQAQVESARQQQALAESRLAAARANLIEAQANERRAAADDERYSMLVAKDEVSRQQYDAIHTAAIAAKAAADAAQAQVNAAQHEIAAAGAAVQAAQGRVAQAEAGVRTAHTAPQQISMIRSAASTAEARVAQAQAALAEAQLNLGYTTVYAPADGLIGNKHVEVGQVLAPGQAALDLVPTNEVWVWANFKETQLQGMSPGDRANVSVDALSKDFRAHVDSIGAATGAQFSLLPPENATGNYVKVVQRIPVKIVFDGGQDLTLLRDGMSVEVTVYLGKKDNGKS